MMEEHTVVFKVKNVEYRCELPPERDVDVERVGRMVRDLFKNLDDGRPKMVMEYLEEAIVRLGVEFMLTHKALESVRDERDD